MYFHPLQEEIGNLSDEDISKRIKELDMNSFVIGTVKDKKEKSSVIFV